jgi:hypothetical protein
MTRTKQQKSEFVSGLGAAFEFVKAISDEVRKLGGNDDDLRKVITQAKLRRQIAESILGRGGKFPSLIHAPELIPEYTDKDGKKCKWEVVEDVEPTPDLDIGKLKTRSFLKDSNKNGYIGGEEMRKRAAESKGGNLGLSDGKIMLVDGGKLIPKEFLDFYIPLPGTLLRGSGGHLNVPYLGFRDGRWDLRFGWLGGGWGDDGRLACSE